MKSQNQAISSPTLQCASRFQTDLLQKMLEGPEEL